MAPRRERRERDTAAAWSRRSRRSRRSRFRWGPTAPSPGRRCRRSTAPRSRGAPRPEKLKVADQVVVEPADLDAHDPRHGAAIFLRSRAEIVPAGHDATSILLYHHSLRGSRTKGGRLVAPEQA